MTKQDMTKKNKFILSTVTLFVLKSNLLSFYIHISILWPFTFQKTIVFTLRKKYFLFLLFAHSLCIFVDAKFHSKYYNSKQTNKQKKNNKIIICILVWCFYFSVFSSFIWSSDVYLRALIPYYFFFKALLTNMQKIYVFSICSSFFQQCRRANEFFFKLE